MTFNEFKYWLEGYTAHIIGAPNEEQWGVIREKLNQVSFTNFTVNPITPPNTIRTFPYNPSIGPYCGPAYSSQHISPLTVSSQNTAVTDNLLVE